MDSGVLRVARGGCWAAAPPLAARHFFSIFGMFSQVNSLTSVGKFTPNLVVTLRRAAARAPEQKHLRGRVPRQWAAGGGLGKCDNTLLTWRDVR